MTDLSDHSWWEYGSKFDRSDSIVIDGADCSGSSLAMTLLMSPEGDTMVAIQGVSWAPKGEGGVEDWGYCFAFKVEDVAMGIKKLADSKQRQANAPIESTAEDDDEDMVEDTGPDMAAMAAAEAMAGQAYGDAIDTALGDDDDSGRAVVQDTPARDPEPAPAQPQDSPQASEATPAPDPTPTPDPTSAPADSSSSYGGDSSSSSGGDSGGGSYGGD